MKITGTDISAKISLTASMPDEPSASWISARTRPGGLDFAAVIASDAARALRLVDELATTGQSLDAFARGVVTNFRNLLLLKIDADLARMVDLPPDHVQRLQQQSETFSDQDLLALIERAGMHFEKIHRSTQPRILLEAAVVEYCRFESRVLLSDLARRLEALGGGGKAAGPAGDNPKRASGPSTRPTGRAI